MEEVEFQVAKMLPEDGDVIVVTFPEKLTTEKAISMYQGWSGVLKSIGKKAAVVLLDDGATIQILKTSQLPDADPRSLGESVK